MTQYLCDSKPAPQSQGMVDDLEEYILAHPDDDESNIPLSSYMKSGLAESVALDLALDHEASEEADTMKESLAARIRQLVAVTKTQLYDATSVNELPSKLENHMKGSVKLAAEEKKSIIHIISVLAPYMTAKEDKNSIVLRLPIVIISNSIQCVADYQEFTRKICPVISPASMHGFRLTLLRFSSLRQAPQSKRVSLLCRTSEQ